MENQENKFGSGHYRPEKDERFMEVMARRRDLNNKLKAAREQVNAMTVFFDQKVPRERYNDSALSGVYNDGLWGNYNVIGEIGEEMEKRLHWATDAGTVDLSDLEAKMAEVESSLTDTETKLKAFVESLETKGE
ncbi:MAG: hypothetical protein HYV54_00270 [Parcubacteria group bacterium]|nr:hypothetical protein [Parcubacteria group bacterium]